MKRNIMLCGLLMATQLAALGWASSAGAGAAGAANLGRSLGCGCCCEDPTCPPGCNAECPPDCVLACLQDCCLDPGCPAGCDEACPPDCAAGQAACATAGD